WSMKTRGASRSSGLRRMREPVITISPGPFADTAGSAGDAWPLTTLGGGSVLCAPAADATVASAAKATPARRDGSIRFILFPLFGQSVGRLRRNNSNGGGER